MNDKKEPPKEDLGEKPFRWRREEPVQRPRGKNRLGSSGKEEDQCGWDICERVGGAGRKWIVGSLKKLGRAGSLDCALEWEGGKIVMCFFPITGLAEEVPVSTLHFKKVILAAFGD